jgi:hypothetical protein
MSTDITLEIIFSLLGGFFLLTGVFLYIRTKNFIGKAQEVKGTVIQMVYSEDSEGGGGYAPIYQFKTLEGQDIEIQDGLSSNPPRFKVGQDVKVLYDPENPRNARLNKWLNLYFLPILFGGLGVIFGGVGIVLVIQQVLRVLGT